MDDIYIEIYQELLIEMKEDKKKIKRYIMLLGWKNRYSISVLSKLIY